MMEGHNIPFGEVLSLALDGENESANIAHAIAWVRFADGSSVQVYADWPSSDAIDVLEETPEGAFFAANRQSGSLCGQWFGDTERLLISQTIAVVEREMFGDA